LSSCPVALSRKTPTQPVRAGGKLSTSVKVINTGATPLDALTVEIGLPSDCCAYKTGVSPRVRSRANKTKTEAVIVNQNVYWLDIPIAPGKARTFSVKTKVSPTYPTGPVAISTLIYAQDADGILVCASTMPDATVRLCV